MHTQTKEIGGRQKQKKGEERKNPMTIASGVLRTQFSCQCCKHANRKLTVPTALTLSFPPLVPCMPWDC